MSEQCECTSERPVLKSSFNQSLPLPPSISPPPLHAHVQAAAPPLLLPAPLTSIFPPSSFSPSTFSTTIFDDDAAGGRYLTRFPASTRGCGWPIFSTGKHCASSRIRKKKLETRQTPPRVCAAPVHQLCERRVGDFFFVASARDETAKRKAKSRRGAHCSFNQRIGRLKSESESPWSGSGTRVTTCFDPQKALFPESDIWATSHSLAESLNHSDLRLTIIIASLH